MTSSTELKIASAMRAVAKELAKQWKRGARAGDVSLDDLQEVLRMLADEIAK